MGIQIFYWMSYGAALSFAAVYLQALEFSNVSIGIVLALGNLFGSLLGTGLSARIDRDERITAASRIPFVIACETAVVLGLLFPFRRWAAFLFFTLYIIFCIALNSLNLKLYVDILHCGESLDYAYSRGIATVCYVIMSVGLGVLIRDISIQAVPLAGLVLCGLQFAAFRMMRRRLPELMTVGSQAARASLPLAAFFARNRRFCVLLAGICLLFIGHGVLANFLINVVQNVGGDSGSMGIVNGFVAGMEIPVMLAFGRFLEKKDMSVLLQIAFVCLTLEAAAVAAARSLPQLALAFLLQAPSYALYTASIVHYVEQNLPYEDSAKAQSLAFTMTTIGTVIASVAGGWLLDTISVSAALWIAAAVSAVGTLVAVSGCPRLGDRVSNLNP